MKPLPPLSTIGILGGGQLGRMMACAAAELGFRCHIFCPDPASPAFEVASSHTIAAYDDMDALDAFAAACDVVTYEFENVPAETAERLSRSTTVSPGPRALEVSQDRLVEKEFLQSIGLQVAPWRRVDNPDDLAAALVAIGPDIILKTRRFGYDGKGQVRVSRGDDPAAAIETAGSGPYVAEKIISFTREISVVGGRAADGSVALFDPAENVHRDQILRTSTVPGNITELLAEQAKDIASGILANLGYVGVIGVELFVTGLEGEETLLVNEIAPRVHNTGHWTQDACATSQFDMHIRAITGWPLGNPARFCDCVMTNLIGDDTDDWPQISVDPNAYLHLYGKTENRPGRKMGHWNKLIRR